MAPRADLLWCRLHRGYAMTTIDRPTSADAAVKAKHRAIWASGDYPALAHDLIAGLGPALVDACGVRPGMRVLDVAAGAGNAALVAADAGADVVASDLTPELLGRRERPDTGAVCGRARRRRRTRRGGHLAR